MELKTRLKRGDISRVKERLNAKNIEVSVQTVADTLNTDKNSKLRQEIEAETLSLLEERQKFEERKRAFLAVAEGESQGSSQTV